MSGDPESLNRLLRENLARHERLVAETAGLRHAAVAVAVVLERGVPGILLTKRASTLRSHGGQWALPGGRLDDGETAVGAALRELSEEVGLDLAEHHVLGVLDDYPTRSGYVISPVVVWGGEDPVLCPNPGEVHSVHHVPFAELQRPDAPTFVTIPESDRPVVQMFFGPSTIHAPTAAVMLQFRRAAIEGVCERVAGYEQPVFAWR
jgi:8-oxo-dGTP pyrophosphatase MutT (NUDIX family)